MPGFLGPGLFVCSTAVKKHLQRGSSMVGYPCLHYGKTGCGAGCGLTGKHKTDTVYIFDADFIRSAKVFAQAGNKYIQAPAKEKIIFTP